MKWRVSSMLCSTATMLSKGSSALAPSQGSRAPFAQRPRRVSGGAKHTALAPRTSCGRCGHRSTCQRCNRRPACGNLAFCSQCNYQVCKTCMPDRLCNRRPWTDPFRRSCSSPHKIVSLSVSCLTLWGTQPLPHSMGMCNIAAVRFVCDGRHGATV